MKKTILLCATYAVGFLSGHNAKHWWIVLVGIATYILFETLFNYLRVTYKINI